MRILPSKSQKLGYSKLTHESLDLIAGEEGSYGLFVTTVDGVTLPSDGDQYWAFYIDGEYASTGVDQTEITAGASYALKAESM